MKVLSVVGNRPQFVKSGPLSIALREAGIDEVVLHTGQHYDRELSDVFFAELGLAEPAYRLEAHTRDEAGRKALFTVAANDLLLSVEDGWLKTMWKPVGFVIFPGRFTEEKWRPVLEAMNTVAASLDATV